MRQLGRGQRRQVVLRARRQRMSGSRRSVPSPEQGASTSTQSNALARRAAAAADRPARAHVRGAARRRPSAAADPCAVAHVAGDEQAAPVPSARRSPWSCRRATRRCRARAAPGDRRRAAPRAATLRPARRTSPASSPAPRSGWPSSTISASGAKAVGCTRLSAVRRRAARSALRGVVRRRLARSVSGAGVLLNRSHASAASKPSGRASARPASAGATA